jgi:autotransporter translocation and assembly factor TamB
MRRLVKKIVRVTLWSVVGVICLALALVLVLRTAPGRRALLRVALPILNGKLAGHLSVRGLDGDLWNRVVLLDARLDDAEGVETIYARRVEARIDLGALWDRRVHLRDLRVDGARLTMRHLTDNRFNLAALGKPKPAGDEKSKKQQASDKPPPLVEIDHFHVQVDGAYHPPRGHESHTIEWPHGTFDIEGAAQFRGADMHFRVDRLVSDARDPLHAHVELRGGLKVTPKGTPVGKAELTFENVELTAVSDGSEIARLNPMLHPRGRWQLQAEGGGSLADLHAHAVLSGPRGSVTVDGTMARMFPGVRWKALLVGAGLDPAADWGEMPRGEINFEIAGGGVRNDGDLRVERLDGHGGGITVAARGHSDFGGHGEGVVRASIDSLARLGDIGVRVGGVDELDGRVRLVANLGRDDAGPRLDASVRGDDLWMRHGRLKTKARLVEAHAVVGPKRPMHVRLGGHDLEIAGVYIAKRSQPFTMRIRELATAIDGQPKRFVADASAELADGTRGRVVARTAVGERTADVTLTTVTLDRGKLHFALPEPAQLHLSGSGAAPRVSAVVAGARLEARMRFGHDLFSADASLALPDLARLGRLAKIDVGGAVHLLAHVTLAEQLKIDATIDGERLRASAARIGRLHATVHSVDLVGDARLDAERVGAGSVILSHLGLQVHGTRERLAVTFDGERPDPRGPARLQLTLDGRWRTDGLQVVDADLWLRAANLTLAKQAWRQVAPAHVVFRRGVGTLRGLRIRSGVGELAVDGRWAKQGLDVTLLLRDGDLQELSRVAGRPGLLPAARWSGRVHLAGTVSAPLVDANLEARADKTVAWLGLGVNALSLTAFADSRHAILHADARGAGDTRVVVDVHGVPRSEGGRIIAVTATLDRMQFSVHGHTWLLREPCTADVGARVEIAQCRLGAPGRGEIALAGSLPLSAAGGDAFDLTLNTSHLDLRDLHAMLAPGHQAPPKTDFEIHAHLAGTKKAPVVDLQLTGRGSQIDEGGLPENVNYKISAHYADKRVRGQASMRQAGMRLGIGATFDLPTTLADGEQPMLLELEARPVPFYKIRQLLPTSIANLKGFFSLRANVTGTTRHPRVNAELHMPSWGLDDLRDNNTIVDLAYDGRELKVNSVTSFEAQGLLGSILRLHPPRNSGTVTMELRAPVDVVQLLQAPRDAVHALVHDAPIVASAEVRNVELRKVPMQIVGFDAPLTKGRINAAVRAGGTLHHPSLHVDFKALDLAKPGIVDQLDLEGALEWEHARVKLSGKAALRGAPLLTFRGQATLDGRQLFDGDGWRTGALLLDVDVPSYELARLRRLQPRLHAVDGTLQAHAQLRGTFAAPDLRVSMQGRDVGIAHSRFSRIGANARLVERRWQFEVTGDEVGGGQARVTGELARDWNAPMRMSIDARALDVGFLGALWAEIGEVRGTLGAHVDVSGSRNAPRPVGWAQLDGGQFALRGDSRRYQAALELRIDGDEARLTRLELHGGGGRLDATGSARLEGLMPTQLALTARAHAFTVAYGSAEARFDADFQLDGDRADGVFHGKLELSRGSIKLPDLSGIGAADELAGLDDVRFDDARARGNEGRRQAGKGVFIVLRVDGPLELRSKEADLDLAGELGVTVAGGTLGIEGVVEAQRGSVELLGKHYLVERAQLAFGGAPDNPELHLRVTRRIGKATVAVVIEGTAKNPSVRLSCEPPMYDEAQLTTLILSGQASSDRLAIRDLNRQISGLLSAVVIRRIQEQLAPGLSIDVARPLDQQSYAEFSAAPLEVGRFASDRIYVRYEQRYSGSRLGRSTSNAEEASADYRLGKGFQLSTSFGDGGVGGVYLFWTAKH